MNFRIGEETHSFTSRYAKLYKFHESLLKNEDFQKSFSYNPPDFPPKSWFTDFTKPKNYKKRANKILKYFRILTSRPSILRNKQFQKGIDLPPNLQKLISQIAKGLQSKKFIEKNYNKKLNRSPHSKSSTPSMNKKKLNNNNKTQRLNKKGKKGINQSIQIFDENESSQQKYNKHKTGMKKERDIIDNRTKMRDNDGTMYDNKNNIKTGHKIEFEYHGKEKQESPKLEILLKDLEIETDKLLIDIIDGIEIKENMENYNIDIDDEMINDLKIFDINDILPYSVLMNDINDDYNKYNNNDKINVNLFKMMNEIEIEQINDIALDIRDAIITACEI